MEIKKIDKEDTHPGVCTVILSNTSVKNGYQAWLIVYKVLHVRTG